VSTLAEALGALEGVEGWMTDGQAAALWMAGEGVPEGGTIVEIGSYHGRSTVVLARAAAGRAPITAIDPHAGNDRGPQQIEGTSAEGEADHQRFLRTLREARVDDRVRHVRLPSARAMEEVEGAIDVLYVDGAHRYGPARDDIARWGARVAPGGLMLVHDAFSSVGVTLAQMRLLVPGASFRYLGRTGSLVRYRREQLDTGERVANAIRQLAELPWFVRNLVVKAAIVTGLRPVARALGHHHGHWPY
jgi:predicted O-methyltransferase YrrM